MKKLIVDLDDTVAFKGNSYENAEPNIPLIERLRQYKSDGFEIAIHTARNMNSYNSNLGKINVETLPVVLKWLDLYGVPYDEVHVGKPWCGAGGFYIDDRAIRPSEFVTLSYQQIIALIEGYK